MKICIIIFRYLLIAILLCCTTDVFTYYHIQQKHVILKEGNILVAQLEQGSNSGYIPQQSCNMNSKPQIVIIKSRKGFRSFWDLHKSMYIPPPMLPEVNFATHNVLGVFWGPKPTTGYSIIITNVVLHNNIIYVYYKTIYPPKSKILPGVITTPFHLVKTYKIPDFCPTKLVRCY